MPYLVQTQLAQDTGIQLRVNDIPWTTRQILVERVVGGNPGGTEQVFDSIYDTVTEADVYTESIVEIVYSPTEPLPPP